MQRLRIGIVGCGQVSQIIHLPTLTQLYPQFEVTALCDVSAAALNAVGDQWQVARRVHDYHELAALHDVDALLLPATGYRAPLFDEQEIVVGHDEVLNVFRGGPVWFTCPMDIAMVPALSIPAGFDAAGLPLGVQLVGRFAEEWTLLRIGRAFQEHTSHHLRVPHRPAGAESP